MREADLVVANGTVITQNTQREIIADGAVAIQADRIVDVAPADVIKTRYSARRTIDATGRFVFPGLVNTHTHSFQTFMKGLGEGLRLYEWVEAVTGPGAAAMTARDYYLAAVLAGLEALHSGTTIVLDYLYPPLDTERYRAVAQAWSDLGLRGIVGLGLIDTGEQYGLPAYLSEPVVEALVKWDKLTAELMSSRLGFALAPAIAFGVTREGLEAVRAYATERGMLISLHTNETPDDDRAILAEHGQRTVPYLEEIGFWGPDVLAVHCVRMQPEDVKIFARHDVKVSHNPVSNMYLGSGAAPIVELRRVGLTVGLATDGAASNNSQDMIETMKCAGLTQKLVQRDPSVITAADVLDMATIEGARALGREQHLGSLEPGKQADLFVMDPFRAKSLPVLDPVATLVFSAGVENVVTTVVAGQVVLDEGQITTVDENALLHECQAAAWDLARRAGTTQLLRPSLRTPMRVREYANHA